MHIYSQIRFKVDSLTADFWYLNGYIYHIEAKYNFAIMNYQQAIIYYNKSQPEALVFVKAGCRILNLQIFIFSGRSMSFLK
jgi:hypothetical protein